MEGHVQVQPCSESLTTKYQCPLKRQINPTTVLAKQLNIDCTKPPVVETPCIWTIVNSFSPNWSSFPWC